ncbi:MAG TPA: sulfatase [Vicinamibacterales bacterium]|nr:sulfatase [Vicinamibacterales bacterium]
MKAASLLAVLIVAKLAMLNGRAIPLSIWDPIAYFWQDVLVALVFGLAGFLSYVVSGFSRTVRSRLETAIYWIVVLYAAANIPVGRALSTPLTWPMVRAAGGPLADSILQYLTWSNVLLVALTIAAAAVLPRVPPLRGRASQVAVACALAVVALGPFAGSRVDASGLDRNILVALVRSALPQIRSRPSDDDWRVSRFDTDHIDDLSPLTGLAAGRNVVVVVLESTAAQYLAPYGGEADVMPSLTALSEHALVFDNAYAVYPESIKGLFSVLCSTSPAFDVEAEAYAGVACNPLPGVLRQAGYRTAMFHSGRFAYLGMEAVIGNRGFDVLEDAGHIGGNHESSFGVDEPSTVRRMLSWVDGLPRGERFFLMYLPIAGHHPYDSPGPGAFANADEFGRYRNALRYGDEALGTLVDGLRARGLGDNTLWIVFGDHGEAFGQHEGNYGHTFFLYDENIRVPLVVAAPGLMHGRTRVRRVVSLLDTAPTILDLLGLDAPHLDQGVSMLGRAPRMALFFTDYSRPLAGLRDGPWKFVYELDTARGRLFHARTDPGERIDVAPDHRDRAAWYAQVVKEWSAAQKSHILDVRAGD